MNAINPTNQCDVCCCLFSAAGIEYIPPSKCLLPVLDNFPNNTTPGDDSLDKTIEVNVLICKKCTAHLVTLV